MVDFIILFIRFEDASKTAYAIVSSSGTNGVFWSWFASLRRIEHEECLLVHIKKGGNR
jgi:hypothetical protein